MLLGTCKQSRGLVSETVSVRQKKKPAKKIVVVVGSPTAAGNTHQPTYLNIHPLTV